MTRTDREYVFYDRETGLAGRVLSVENARTNAERWAAAVTDTKLVSVGATKDEAVARVIALHQQNEKATA